MYSKYGCLVPLGERRNEQRKEPEETRVRIRSCFREKYFRSEKDLDPVLADGNVIKAGIARVLSVYERPYVRG